MHRVNTSLKKPGVRLFGVGVERKGVLSCGSLVTGDQGSLIACSTAATNVAFGQITQPGS
jgi:hypothetical protein